MPHELHIFPPDGAPADLLLERIGSALGDGGDVLYLTPSDTLAR